MNILVISDKESPYYWDFYDKTKLADIDLIISCGDLDPEYLSFLVTFSKGPVLYVHGNHDDKYEKHPPEGCECIDNKIYVYKGVRFMGLGGSMRYREGVHQYTEAGMIERACRMIPALIWHRGFDVLVTHSPARGLGDTEDLPHRGFKVFRWLMEMFKPKYMLHGHVHLSYNYAAKRETEYEQTKIINAYERYILHYDV